MNTEEKLNKLKQLAEIDILTLHEDADSKLILAQKQVAQTALEIIADFKKNEMRKMLREQIKILRKFPERYKSTCLLLDDYITNLIESLINSDEKDYELTREEYFSINK